MGVSSAGTSNETPRENLRRPVCALLSPRPPLLQESLRHGVVGPCNIRRCNPCWQHHSSLGRRLHRRVIVAFPGSPCVVSFGLRVSSSFPEFTLNNGIGTATTSFVHPELMGVCGQNAMYTWDLDPKSALQKIEVDLQSQNPEYSVSTRWVYHVPHRILFQLKKTSNEELAAGCRYCELARG